MVSAREKTTHTTDEIRGYQHAITKQTHHHRVNYKEKLSLYRAGDSVIKSNFFVHSGALIIFRSIF